MNIKGKKEKNELRHTTTTLGYMLHNITNRKYYTCVRRHFMIKYSGKFTQNHKQMYHFENEESAEKKVC